MKIKIIKLALILIVAELITFADADKGYAENWKAYGVSDNYSAFYDAESILTPSEHFVTVWAKWVFTEKGSNDFEKTFGLKGSFGLMLWEFNCKEKKAHRLSLTYYSNDKKVLHHSNSLSDWIFIGPGQMIEFLYKEVCK